MWSFDVHYIWTEEICAMLVNSLKNQSNIKKKKKAPFLMYCQITLVTPEDIKEATVASQARYKFVHLF